MPQFRSLPSFDNDDEKEQPEEESAASQSRKTPVPPSFVSNLTTGHMPVLLLSGPHPTVDSMRLAAMVRKPANTDGIEIGKTTGDTTSHRVVIPPDEKLKQERAARLKDKEQTPMSPQKNRRKKALSIWTVLLVFGLELAVICLLFSFNVPLFRDLFLATSKSGSVTMCGNECGAHSINLPALSDPASNAAVPTPAPNNNGGSSSGPDPSGQAMPLGDIAGWHQIFTDDFNTNIPLGSFPSAVSGRWGAYDNGWNDTYNTGQYYPSRTVSVHNGILDVHLHTENGINMVAAIDPKLPGATGSEGGMLYGRYVIRFRADAVSGYKTAWLLWPDDENWPGDGEIDFPEANLDSSICGYMHWEGATSGSQQDAYCTDTTYTSWHTAIIEWTPSRLNFIMDGVTIGSSTSHIPDTPMHWVIQTETTSQGPDSGSVGDVQIDWVAVYAPS